MSVWPSFTSVHNCTFDFLISFVRWMVWAFRAAVNSEPWRCSGGLVLLSGWGCWERPSAFVTSCPQFLLCSPSDIPTASMKAAVTNQAWTRFRRQVLRSDKNWQYIYSWANKNAKVFIDINQCNFPCWGMLWLRFSGISFDSDWSLILVLLWATDELLYSVHEKKKKNIFSNTSVLVVCSNVFLRLPGISSLREISRRAAYASRRPRHNPRDGKFPFP